MALMENQTTDAAACPDWCTSPQRDCASTLSWHWGPDRQVAITVTTPDDRQQDPDVLDISIASCRLEPENAHIWLEQEPTDSQLRFTADEARTLAHHLIELAAELDNIKGAQR